MIFLAVFKNQPVVPENICRLGQTGIPIPIDIKEWWQAFFHWIVTPEPGINQQGLLNTHLRAAAPREIYRRMN